MKPAFVDVAHKLRERYMGRRSQKYYIWQIYHKNCYLCAYLAVSEQR